MLLPLATTSTTPSMGGVGVGGSSKEYKHLHPGISDGFKNNACLTKVFIQSKNYSKGAEEWSFAVWGSKSSLEDTSIVGRE